MKYVKKLELNEGLFDKQMTYSAPVLALYKNLEKMKKAITTVMTTMADKAKKFFPKAAKPLETWFIVMGDGKNAANDFTISLTKLADLPDGSGLFQISGSSNPAMIKAITGKDKNEDLAKNSVMAMVAPGGLEKGKIATFKLLKNIMPDGKDYITKAFVQGAVPKVEVDKAMAKIK